MQAVRGDKGLEVSYMTLAQKMLDERRLGYEEGIEEGIEAGLRKAIMALQGVVTPAVIAERFQMPLEQVMEILGH